MPLEGQNSPAKPVPPAERRTETVEDDYGYQDVQSRE
jgi:hypothetical protein